MFDFWTRARIRLEELGEAVSWGLAVSLVKGFQLEWGTHTHAAVNGWFIPATYGEVMAALHAADFKYANTEEKDHHKIQMLFPWTPAESAGAPAVTEEELAVINARLDRVSAIPD